MYPVHMYHQVYHAIENTVVNTMAYNGFPVFGLALSIFFGMVYLMIREQNTCIPSYLVVYINNSLHLARKYVTIFVRGHYLLREARGKL